jgi:26S proteasome regulatory subunit T6
MSCKVQAAAGPQAAGIHSYYQGKIEELEAVYRERAQNLRRLEAQRNELNTKVRLLREELQLLQEPGSYVGEVVKAMGKNKVLVKVCQNEFSPCIFEYMITSIANTTDQKRRMCV